MLAILVGWFLLKTLPKTFRDRSSRIQKHLVDARTATEEASARLNSVEDRLGKLDEQIAAMRAQSEKDSALDEQRIKASVEDEKQKILTAAEQEISAATVQARRQLQQYAAELAIEQAARKLVVIGRDGPAAGAGFCAPSDGRRCRRAAKTNVCTYASLCPRLCLCRGFESPGCQRGAAAVARLQRDVCRQHTNCAKF